MEKYSVNMEKSPSKTGTGCAKPDYFHKKERKYGEKCVFIPENGSINFKGADLCFSSRTMKKGNGNPLEGVAQTEPARLVQIYGTQAAFVKINKINSCSLFPFKQILHVILSK